MHSTARYNYDKNEPLSLWHHQTICDRCDRTVNCFGSSQAQEFLKIMGSTQKRMFLHHPIMTVKHKLASMGVDYAKYQQAKKIDDKVKAKDKAAKGRAKERKSQK